MKTDNSFGRDWDDLVFENRNRDYGAYVLRKSYQNTLLEAALVSLIVAGLVFGLPQVYTYFFGGKLVIKPITVLPPLNMNQKFDILVKPRITVPRNPVKRASADIAPVVTTLPDPVETAPVQPTTTDNGSSTGSETGTDMPTTGSGSEGTATALPVIDAKTPRDYAEVMPSYKGGTEAMMKFLQKKVRYPHSARINETQGKVFVQFVVNTEGKVVDVKVVRGISGDCDQEAARVISLMDGWKPGKMGSTPVSVRMMLPIYFKLN